MCSVVLLYIVIEWRVIKAQVKTAEDAAAEQASRGVQKETAAFEGEDGTGMDKSQLSQRQSRRKRAKGTDLKLPIEDAFNPYVGTWFRPFGTHSYPLLSLGAMSQFVLPSASTCGFLNRLADQQYDAVDLTRFKLSHTYVAHDAAVRLRAMGRYSTFHE